MRDPRFDTLLPADLEAERLLLGAGLVDSEVQAAIVNDVNPEDFSTEAHRIIFAAMRDCYEQLGDWDRVQIANVLRGQGKLEAVGGLTYLMRLDEGTPQNLNWAGYSRIVKEKATLRRGIFAAQALIDELFMGVRPNEQLLASAAGIQEVLGAQRAETQTAGEIIQDKGFEGLFGNAASAEGVMLPWASLAEIVPLLRPGNLVVLAAGTGYGKSSFARQIALDVALRQFKGAFIASYEMTKDEVLVAMACTHGEINSWKVDTGVMSTFERQKLFEATGDLQAAPLHLFDGSPTLATLEAEIRKTAAKLSGNGQKLGIVVVDYLQLMDPGRRTSGETERVSAVARGLKNMASRLNVPILALSQFARPERGKTYTGDEMMGMLKNSSEIEQAANLIMLLEPMPVENSDPTAPPPKTIPYKVHIPKQRKGPKGMKTLLFDRWITRFREEEKVHGLLA